MCFWFHNVIRKSNSINTFPRNSCYAFGSNVVWEYENALVTIGSKNIDLKINLKLIKTNTCSWWHFETHDRFWLHTKSRLDITMLHKCPKNHFLNWYKRDYTGKPNKIYGSYNFLLQLIIQVYPKYYLKTLTEAEFPINS